MADPGRSHHPEVVLIRHGKTEWSLSGQHTGSTDLPLTEKGRQAARLLEPFLSRMELSLDFCSPLQRATQTCQLAGLGGRMVIEPDLLEWNYGDYEGPTTAEIHRTAPGWQVFRDGCPAGEAPWEVSARADRLITRLRQQGGRVALFAHGHFLLDTATASILSDYRGTPALKCWNAPLQVPAVQAT